MYRVIKSKREKRRLMPYPKAINSKKKELLIKNKSLKPVDCI